MIRKFIINVNGKRYDVEVTEITEIQETDQKLIDESKPNTTTQQTSTKVQETPSAVGAIKITAPMPGTILKINVEEGKQVKKGEVLLILEAMKMENEIVAPKDGRVVSINVSKGTKVNAGDLLVSME